MLGLTIAFLVSEVRFGLEAVSTTATVEKYTRRSVIGGRGGGTAVHMVDGIPMKATFRSWSFYRSPAEGEHLSVMFRPGEPGFLVIDSFLQRYGPLAFPLVIALAAAFWAGVFQLHREAPSLGQPGDSREGAAEPR